MSKRLIKDIFTSTGVLITPNVREMQLEFHELQRKKAAIKKAYWPARERYRKFRETYGGSSAHLLGLGDQLQRANEQYTVLDNQMSGLTRAVEAIHVYQRNGINLRPDVATMGKPK